ncbi:hypothetical protein ACRQ5Q_41690 (plasmid) [Bradyrhizobium sp. PMVTL-01]|uniref:hypothetical protein n=1 Tax=Bradyrhizobium sp. PMVTL-01 TaxID=3434999 RepID=UPI003F6E4C56
MEAAVVATCAVTREAYADALAEVQTKIADAEQKLAAERATVEREAASEKLAQDLDAVERALPDYLAAGKRFADALEKLHFHPESSAMGLFIGNTAAQVEVAAGFALVELRCMVNAIRDGVTPIPAAKPVSASVPVTEPLPPTQTVFMMKFAKYRTMTAAPASPDNGKTPPCPWRLHNVRCAFSSSLLRHSARRRRRRAYAYSRLHRQDGRLSCVPPPAARPQCALRCHTACRGIGAHRGRMRRTCGGRQARRIGGRRCAAS